MIRKQIYTLGLSLICLSPVHGQEIKYVTDVLLLSLYEKQGSEGEMLMKLPSGSRLEVLEENKFFARVRTEEGIEGWTKSVFLTPEIPARARVVELEQQHEQLTERFEQTRKALDEAKQRIAGLQQQQRQDSAKLADRDRSRAESDGLIAQLREENKALRQSLEDSAQQIPLRWVKIAAPILFLLGLIAGIYWFDYRSRRRHGGYRIY